MHEASGASPNFYYMLNLPKPIIQKHGRFFVLRDDLLHGGTKRRVLTDILSKLPESEIVYPSHPLGYAHLALALAALDTGKKVKLFFQQPPPYAYTFLEAIKLPNVSFEIINEVSRQMDLIPYAQQYAAQNNAKFLPIGFDYPEFSNGLVRLAQSLQIEPPHEVWTLGGSGTLSRTLQKAWPKTQVNTVSLGFPQGNMGNSRVFTVAERTEEVAQVPPPYPSAPYYDAKLWRFANEHGTDGALIWNVA